MNDLELMLQIIGDLEFTRRKLTLALQEKIEELNRVVSEGAVSDAKSEE